MRTGRADDWRNRFIGTRSFIQIKGECGRHLLCARQLQPAKLANLRFVQCDRRDNEGVKKFFEGLPFTHVFSNLTAVC